MVLSLVIMSPTVAATAVSRWKQETTVTVRECANLQVKQPWNHCVLWVVNYGGSRGRQGRVFSSARQNVYEIVARARFAVQHAKILTFGR